jgi:hypothetical protein
VWVADQRKTESAGANLGRAKEQMTLACRVEVSVPD